MDFNRHHTLMNIFVKFCCVRDTVTQIGIALSHSIVLLGINFINPTNNFQLLSLSIIGNHTAAKQYFRKKWNVLKIYLLFSESVLHLFHCTHGINILFSSVNSWSRHSSSGYVSIENHGHFLKILFHFIQFFCAVAISRFELLQLKAINGHRLYKRIDSLIQRRNTVNFDFPLSLLHIACSTL